MTRMDDWDLENVCSSLVQEVDLGIWFEGPGGSYVIEAKTRDKRALRWLRNALKARGLIRD